MRILVTLIIALAASCLAAGLVAVAMAEWADGDESFILVFIGIPVVALVVSVLLLIAHTRPVLSRAMNRVALFLVGLFLVLFGLLAVVELAANGTMASAWRGIKLIATMCASATTLVAAQWIVFRWRGRIQPKSVTPRFGRNAGPA